MNLQLVRGAQLWGDGGRLGYSRPTVYAHVKAGLLTPPVKLSARASAWPVHEIDALIAARIGGKTDAEIKALVTQLVAKRAEIAQRAAA